MDIDIHPVSLLHSDTNGWIINAAGLGSNAEAPLVCQPRLLSNSPGSVRGNHYHPNIEEAIVFISGRWQVIMATPDLKDRVYIIL